MGECKQHMGRMNESRRQKGDTMYRDTGGIVPIKKLPGLGSIELIDIYGSEEGISKIAGISHGSDEGPGVKKLLKWGHLSPFEFVHVTFKVSAPIFVARQWFRHRTGKYMEKSGRYTKFDAGNIAYVPLTFNDDHSEIVISSMQQSINTYNTLIESGMPLENARSVLPMGINTEFYFQMDMRNLLNFMKLRLDGSAQTEIRMYAQAMLEMLEPNFPVWCVHVKEIIC